MNPTRRKVLGVALAVAGAVAGSAVGGTRKRSAKAGRLRPPGALPEEDFLAQCIRCFKCGDVCENACIEFHGLDEGLAMAFTPFVHPRSRGCTSCMKCTEVCPSGALEAIAPTEVQMGLARLNEDMCYSYVEPARTCGVCYRACPYPGKAMTISLYERPTVHAEFCTGCGLCEQSCVHLPQAIRVLPVRRT